MANLNAWDGFLLIVGAYVAVMALVRLMRAHRQKLTNELQDQIIAEQQRTKGKQPTKNKSHNEAA